MILGWQEGITYFKEGGEGVLLIPSSLAYGSNGTGPIPGGAVLVFDEPLGQARMIAFPMIWAALVIYSITLIRQMLAAKTK